MSSYKCGIKQVLFASHLRGFAFLICMTLMAPAALASEQLTLPAEPIIVENFAKWTSKQDCTSIKSFDSPYANRGTVEVILICQALEAGGYKTTIKLAELPNYTRSIVEVKKGKFPIAAESVWDTDSYRGGYFITDPVIQDGEFQKGIYALPESAVLKVKNIQELRPFVAVTPRNWVVDWKTVEDFKLSTQARDVQTKENIFRLLGSKRVDFTLLEFSNSADLMHEFTGVRLMPAQGIKVTLKGARRFVVSQAYPGAPEIFAALQRGIKILRANGTISRAFKESGFFNQQTQNWHSIN